MKLQKWEKHGKTRYYIDVPTAYNTKCFIDIRDSKAYLVFNEPSDAVMVDIAYDRIEEVIGQDMMNAFLGDSVISENDFNMYLREEKENAVAATIETESDLTHDELKAKLDFVNKLLKKVINEERSNKSFFHRPHYNQYIIARDRLQKELKNCFLKGGGMEVPPTEKCFSKSSPLHYFGLERIAA